MSKMLEALEMIATEHRDLDAVKSAFLQLRALENFFGIEKAIIALTLNPGGNNLMIDVNVVVAAYLVGITWDIDNVDEAWLEAIDFMSEFEPKEREVELADLPF